MYPNQPDPDPTTAADYAALAAEASADTADVHGATERVKQYADTVRVGPTGMPFAELVKQEPLAGVGSPGFSFERMDLQPWQVAAVAGLRIPGTGLALAAALGREEQRAAEDVIEGRVLPDGPWKLPRYHEDPRPHPDGVFGDLIDAMSKFARSFVDGLTAFGEAAAEAGVVPEQPPTDPRARALWMKQHRGHGPETPKSWRQR